MIYINLQIDLNEEQLKQIEKDVSDKLEALLVQDDTINKCIDVQIKSQLRSIVNEQIQTKDFRNLLTDRVHDILQNKLGGTNDEEV